MTEELKEVKDEMIDSEKKPSTDEVKPEAKEVKPEDDFKRNVESKPSKTDEVVPLKKYLDKKTKIKELEGTVSELNGKLAELNSKTLINNNDLDKFIEEFGLNPEATKKLAAILTPKQNANLEKKLAELEESNKSLLQKEERRDQKKQFEKHFKDKIIAKYPELKEKKSLFKQVWFSPTFPHLKTLEDIKTEFFPHIKGVETGVKKESLESGSGGQSKGVKEIDFSKMTDEQHLEVLKDKDLKAKYYAWSDSQGR